MSIIFRYLSKEILSTTLAVTTIVVFTFLCNEFIRYLGLIANGKYAANMLFQLTLVETPSLFSLLLPLGLFLAIILSYSRLYADSEMTIFFVCGVSYKKLFNMTMKIVLSVALLVGILVLWVNPILAKHRDQMLTFAKSTTIFQMMVPGRFQASQNGKNVFYAKNYSKDGKYLNNLFIAQKINTKKKTQREPQWMILSAEKAHQTIDKKTGEHFLIAENGYRYQGAPGQKDYQKVKYKSYAARISLPKLTHNDQGIETVPTHKLIAQSFSNRDSMAELQWRLSLPISVIVLALLAFPLSRVSPREGRFKYLIPAILIYVIYVNLLFISRNWLETGLLSAWIGLWWIHFSAAALGIFLGFYTK